MKKINGLESVWGRVLLQIKCQGRPFQGGDICADHLNNEKEPAWEDEEEGMAGAAAFG